MTKTCNDCSRELPATHEFFPYSRHGKVTTPCNECRSERTKRYHSTNPTSRIAAQLKRKYGLSLEQYDTMFATQDGKCAICGKHQSECSKRLAVDHDHTTGEVRALLCQQCNQGFGMFREDVEVMRRAIAYKELHG